MKKIGIDNNIWVFQHTSSWPFKSYTRFLHYTGWFIMPVKKFFLLFSLESILRMCNIIPPDMIKPKGHKNSVTRPTYHKTYLSFDLLSFDHPRHKTSLFKAYLGLWSPHVNSMGLFGLGRTSKPNRPRLGNQTLVMPFGQHPSRLLWWGLPLA